MALGLLCLKMLRRVLFLFLPIFLFFFHYNCCFCCNPSFPQKKKKNKIRNRPQKRLPATIFQIHYIPVLAFGLQFMCSFIWLLNVNVSYSVIAHWKRLIIDFRLPFLLGFFFFWPCFSFFFLYIYCNCLIICLHMYDLPDTW